MAHAPQTLYFKSSEASVRNIQKFELLLTKNLAWLL